MFSCCCPRSIESPFRGECARGDVNVTCMLCVCVCCPRICVFSVGLTCYVDDGVVGANMFAHRRYGRYECDVFMPVEL